MTIIIIQIIHDNDESNISSIAIILIVKTGSTTIVVINRIIGTFKGRKA